MVISIAMLVYQRVFDGFFGLIRQFHADIVLWCFLPGLFCGSFDNPGCWDPLFGYPVIRMPMVFRLLAHPPMPWQSTFLGVQLLPPEGVPEKSRKTGEVRSEVQASSSCIVNVGDIARFQQTGLVASVLKWGGIQAQKIGGEYNLVGT